jgi:predicted short-subunit dehydrogenase-like oxidoreductase (DUF2520 family)
MAQREIKTAVLIGAGNLGWHLGQTLHEKGIRILQVLSRSEPSCKELAVLLHADCSTRLEQMKSTAGIIIIAIPDTQIDKVIGHVDFGNTLVVHTAGSVPMDVFKGKAAQYGVLYPLMTFTRKKPVDFDSVPLLIEANSAENMEKLRHFAEKLSEEVRPVNSEERKIVHLAAVIASNFPNHMYTLAENLMTRKGIPFDLLKPLIRETTDKINLMSPRSAQTGPAVRDDKATLERHLKLLADDADIAELYRQISKSIITFARKPAKKK